MSVEASDSSRLINVKVLSQLPEPDGLIHFENLPVTTTVGELKVKVRDHAASKPAVEDQRFIYRGRLMARENDTLMDVFGRDAVCLHSRLERVKALLTMTADPFFRYT